MAGISEKDKQVACFTGHRPKGLPWGYDENRPVCLHFKARLTETLRAVVSQGVDTFLTGMAEGFDMMAAEAVLQLKKEFPQVKLVAVLPCRGQDAKWSLMQRQRYKRILSACNEVITLSPVYTPTCMNDRNRYLVEHADLCIA